MTNLGPRYLSESELASLPFKSCGRNVLISERVNFVGLENLSLGSNVRIDADVTILATGPVQIGNYVHIGSQCYLAGRGGITLHDFGGLSQGVKLYSGSDDYSGETLTNPTVPAEFTGVKLAPIIVGRHVIIGAGSVVLPGAIIGEGSCVGALSLVKGECDPWGCYVGIPARRTINRSRALLEKEHSLLMPKS